MKNNMGYYKILTLNNDEFNSLYKKCFNVSKEFELEIEKGFQFLNHNIERELLNTWIKSSKNGDFYLNEDWSYAWHHYAAIYSKKFVANLL